MSRPIASRLLAALGLAMALALPADAQEMPVQYVDGDTRIMAAKADSFGAVILGGQSADGRYLINFDGQCAATVSPTFLVMDPAAVARFQSSGALADLGGEDFLHHALTLLAQVCPDMTSASPRLGNLPDVPNVALLLLSNGWREGAGEQPGRLLSVSLRDSKSAAFVDHQPRCGAEVALPMQTSQTGRATPRMDQYQDFASIVASAIGEQCQQAERVRFNLRVLPQNTSCASDGAGCYVVAVRQGDIWTAERDNIVLPRGGREALVIGDFDDMIRFLVDGRREHVLIDAPDYFGVFHNQFLRAYSDYCSASIANPVVLPFEQLEITLDGMGNEISSRRTGEGYSITIDRRFQDAFRNYTGRNKLWLAERILQMELAGRRANIGGGGASAVGSQLLRDRNQVNRFIQQGCDSANVQAVYRSL